MAGGDIEKCAVNDKPTLRVIQATSTLCEQGRILFLWTYRKIDLCIPGDRREFQSQIYEKEPKSNMSFEYRTRRCRPFVDNSNFDILGLENLVWSCCRSYSKFGHGRHHRKRSDMLISVQRGRDLYRGLRSQHRKGIPCRCSVRSQYLHFSLSGPILELVTRQFDYLSSVYCSAKFRNEVNVNVDNMLNVQFCHFGLVPCGAES